MSPPQHGNCVDVVWHGFLSHKTTVHNKDLEQPARFHRDHQLFEASEKAHTLIGIMETPEPRFYFGKVTIKNPGRQKPMRIKRRNWHASKVGRKTLSARKMPSPV